ncbi:MAG TPA: hypothetical protein VD833_16245 [Vicinamibacterales bacterium]|nr:hypothetical protein [Vicinamibacterales bacterium]
MPAIGVIVAGLLLVAGSASGQTQDVSEARAALLAALERLIATGEPSRATHDEGQHLQIAVSDAIARGDEEIERLASRAAFPLIATASRPVSPITDLPAITIDARQVLRLPRPVPFEAMLHAAVDGREFVPAGRIGTGTRWGGRIDTLLPPGASTPGVHRVRVRAHLVFGGPDDRRWTEVRDLPELSYALFDPDAPADAISSLLTAPATASAGAFAEGLPDLPFGAWLLRLVNGGDPKGKRPVDWMSQFCSERLEDTGRVPRSGDLCSVAWFEHSGEIFRIWFKTGNLRFTEAGPEWRVNPPVVEGINSAHSGAAASTLAEFLEIVSGPRESWPSGDVAIAPGDIVISAPDPARAYRSTVTVTVRNNGTADVAKVQVSYTVADDAVRRPDWRTAVVDVPRRGSTDVTFEAEFPRGYGFVIAHALQWSDASPHDTFASDPTPDDACAFRVVNAAGAPRDYVKSLGDASGCRGW